MTSVPLLSSAEEAEEYDLLPTPSSSSSSSHPQSRRRSSGSGPRSSWLPSVHTKLGGGLALAATFVVGVVAGQVLIPTSSLLPLFPSSSSPSTSPNPFNLPGFILNRPILPPEADVNEPWGWYDRVRWKTVPSLTAINSGEGRLERRDRDGSEESDIEFEEEDPSLLEELKIAHERGVIPEGWSDWGVNKTILGIGDSLMRNNVMFFTKHIAPGDIQRQFVPFQDEQGSKWKDINQAGVVDVPVVDLKMVNLFHQGMIESPVVGFFDNQSEPQPFEEKLANVFLPSWNDPKGLNGRVPDLIIFESLSWDLVLLANLARDSGDTRYEGRPLDDVEIAFTRGRIVEVLGLLRRTFPTSKIILQTPHIGAKSANHVFSPIRKFQQAQTMHSISLETGVELFDWGRLVSSLSNEMQDGLHFLPGAATWIWGEMVLYYLRETSLTKVPPPPPASTLPSSRITQQDVIDSYSQPKHRYPKPQVNERRRRLAEDPESLEGAMRLLSK
ncbi:hypothetical protein BDY24DRAFT_388999 [Mrakia frigida]|uniref:uncharacterized protein n=1 Tax=Mrakia frigida TaxID=29902 RepID=UPI003FCC2152